MLTAPFDRRTWLATSYAVLGTVVGVFGALLVALLLLSLALSFTVVGALLLLGGTLLLARRLARLERTRAEVVLGLTIADPHEPAVGRWWVGCLESWRAVAHPVSLLPTGLPGWLVVTAAWLGGSVLRRVRADLFLLLTLTEPRPAPEGKWWQRVVAMATDLQTWREIAYLTLLAPLGLAGCIVVVAAWTGAAVLVLLPLYNPMLGNTGAHVLTMVVDTVPETMLMGAVGIGLVLAAPWIARAVAGAESRLAAGLLGPSERAALHNRVDELRARREQLVEVVEAERRRIERDLHDGAQQRLVALAMNLGMAKDKFDKDPSAARALLDEAHADAKQAMVELRNLARGIHPAVLSDRGLDAALSSLAGKAPVPVSVEVWVPDRPPAAIETTAYYVVAEALTNIAKHAGASQAAVTVARQNGHLKVVVTDDGIGGADAARGTGLSGLVDRVTAVDGTVRLSSPVGGPTILTVELPCAS
ncbi:MAG TPA: sensor histidine kinase [Acidimicrobiia bacterium]|nr:sensor histidine kinase [Acidimicrobiia bacterium]